MVLHVYAFQLVDGRYFCAPITQFLIMMTPYNVIIYSLIELQS